MTDTLDLPQHEYVCLDCGREGADILIIVQDCTHGRIVTRPTLTFSAFESYMLKVWDELERNTDTSETNREAIDAAIRAVGRREDH